MGIAELDAWLTGRKQRRARAADLTLLPAEDLAAFAEAQAVEAAEAQPAAEAQAAQDAATHSTTPLTLGSISWDGDALRAAIHSMLQRHDLTPLDLLRAYDKSEDGAFSLRE